MIYRIRSATLEDLHHAITQSFGFLGNEMASFYKSDEVWQQGEELPLESMGEVVNMRDEPLNKVFTSSQHHLIYVYDFLNLWTFFVELKELGDVLTSTSYPNLIHSEGDVPEEAPEKIFESEKQDTEIDDNEEDVDS